MLFVSLDCAKTEDPTKPCFLLEDTCRIFHTVKSVKNQVGDKGNKMIYVKGKDLLPFEKLPFRNGQPVRDGERRTFVAMTST
jgi:hypothetical protein